MSVSEEVDTGCGPHHLHIAKVLAKVHCVVARATTVQVVTGVDLCHNLHAFAFKLYETRQGIQKKCLDVEVIRDSVWSRIEFEDELPPLI